MALRLVLADDHRIVREGVRALLEKIPLGEVVGEAADGREALDLVAKHQPDILLLDIAMPKLNGLDAIARIRKESPETKVIILSMHANEEYVVRALRSKVSGYLIKDCAVEELERAIHTVATGGTYVSKRISKQAVQAVLENTKSPQAPIERLTARQREVLQLIGEGNNTKEMADLLAVSIKTIEAHRLQLMQRLSIHDVAGLVRFAIRNGLVSAEK
jgi:DNA-binding NarL/FixJ family response regulator